MGPNRDDTRLLGVESPDVDLTPWVLVVGIAVVFGHVELFSLVMVAQFLVLLVSDVPKPVAKFVTTRNLDVDYGTAGFDCE